MWKVRSLTVRVLLLSSVWAVVALVVVGGLISSLYEETARRGFEDLLTAQLYNLVNSVSTTPSGTLSGSPDLGDLRYLQPLSGWYWEVVPASPNTNGRLSSGSLGALRLGAPTVRQIPFQNDYRRNYLIDGLNGEKVRVIETEVVLDGANHVARFRVMGNASTVSKDVRAFDRTLFFYLGGVGLGSVLVNGLVILFGLAPLRRVRRALTAVRTGRAERLEGDFPVEIEPLAVETNALIENNRRIVERARTQVGNLAHSLKTPLAILTNESFAEGGERGRILGDQVERMRAQVQHYLDRARVAAQNEGGVFRTPVAPVLESLLRVVAKLNPTLDFAFEETQADGLAFAGEREDLEEMVGNLLENAGKWAGSCVRVRVAAASPDGFAITVEDDGPGLDAAQAKEATKRGRRLDEAAPGSGLGLSIVADTVAQYRGRFDLGRSELGGLEARLELPRAPGGDLRR